MERFAKGRTVRLKIVPGALCVWRHDKHVRISRGLKPGRPPLAFLRVAAPMRTVTVKIETVLGESLPNKLIRDNYRRSHADHVKDLHDVFV